MMCRAISHRSRASPRADQKVSSSVKTYQKNRPYRRSTSRTMSSRFRCAVASDTSRRCAAMRCTPSADARARHGELGRSPVSVYATTCGNDGIHVRHDASSRGNRSSAHSITTSVMFRMAGDARERDARPISKASSQRVIV